MLSHLRFSESVLRLLRIWRLLHPLHLHHSAPHDGSKATPACRHTTVLSRSFRCPKRGPYSSVSGFKQFSWKHQQVADLSASMYDSASSVGLRTHLPPCMWLGDAGRWFTLADAVFLLALRQLLRLLGATTSSEDVQQRASARCNMMRREGGRIPRTERAQGRCEPRQITTFSKGLEQKLFTCSMASSSSSSSSSSTSS